MTEGKRNRMKELTHAQCKVLAGDPLILAASDEQAIREEWRKRERVFNAAMKWYRGYADTPSEAMEGTWHAKLVGVHKACAAARKK